jgi:hypothetical protein
MMNDYDDLQCYLDRWPQDYQEHARLLPVHPLSASALALNAPLEWLALRLASSGPQALFADSAARY